jgi:hypothetical protein
LEVEHGPVELAAAVEVDAEPVHLAAIGTFVAADDWNVVLRLTGDDACLTAGAATEVDGHRPFVGGVVVVRRIQARRRRASALLGYRIRVGAQRGERGAEHNRSGVHGEGKLALNELVTLPKPLDGDVAPIGRGAVE